jgi:hypothetical protein
VTQLYPRALGSLFVASYDSEGYGGGIRNRLHTGLKSDSKLRGLSTKKPNFLFKTFIDELTT